MTPAVTYVNNYMGSHITAKGWEDMGADSLAVDSRFFEFGNFGLGAKLMLKIQQRLMAMMHLLLIGYQLLLKQRLILKHYMEFLFQ